MSEKDNISSLFDRSGNLTLNAMERYSRNELTNAERSLVEEHIAKSEFDREALEGLKNHFSSNLGQDINDLNSDILFAARKRARTGNLRKSGRFYLYAAAGLAILVSLSVLIFFIFRAPVEKPQLAVTQPDKIVDSTTAAAGLKENSRIIEKKNVTEIKSYTRLDEDIEPEPEKSITSSEINPEPQQQDSVQKPIEPDKIITTINDQVVVDEDPITDEFNVGGAAISGDHNYSMDKLNLMDERAAADYEIQSKNAIVVSEAVSPEKQSEDQVFMVVEQMPEFPGGDTALWHFLTKNIHYPDSAKQAAIQGTVYVTFIVNKEGSVTKARVLRGIGDGCDSEALRVVNLMPKWKPGKQRGTPVEVQYNLSIKFNLGI